MSFGEQEYLITCRLSTRTVGPTVLAPRPARVMSTHAQQTTNTNSPSSYREDEIIFNPVSEVCMRCRSLCAHKSAIVCQAR